jgi:uroporphyrin-III C-methyltransferase/precorrin-2 dehydrogenase/sirohydrochlorin ferrochelatase
MLMRAGARLVAEDDRSARLGFVAIEDDAVAGAAVTRLRQRGLLVNAADRPDLCDFTMPAIVDRTPVLIAIGTGGTSAGLAKALRGRIEALLPSSLGVLSRTLGAARVRLRTRFPDAEARRRALDAALARGGALDPEMTHDPGAVDRWLAEDVAGQVAARRERIGLRSADPDDLTLREARLLATAERVYHRETVPAAILDRVRADAVRISCDLAPSEVLPGLSLDLGWAD